MVATFANEVICVSSVIENRLAAEYPGGKDRFTTIRNGAPPAEIDDRPRERVLGGLNLTPGGYVLCVGRLDPTKGFHDVIEAFRRAKPPGMKLVLVGDALGDETYARKLRAGASGDIVFAGARSAADVRTLYRNAALFVHPSYMEGFAMVVLEAIGADIPMLVSDIPPHLEVGLDEANYYPCGNVAALAKILGRSSYDELRCSRRVAILTENDWDSVARRHRDILVRPARDRQPARAPAGS
jgi:glycosyltransferase involved in cell wall biosynthesis